MMLCGKDFLRYMPGAAFTPAYEAAGSEERIMGSSPEETAPDI